MAEDDAHAKAQAVLKAFKKQTPNVRIFRGSDPEVQIQVQSTGIPILDELIRGIKCGGHTLIYGPNKGGKTTLAGQITAQMQEDQRKVLMGDLENRLDPQWWGQQGVNLDELDILTGGDDFEEDMDAIFAVLREGIYSGLVMDSITAKAARGELQDKAGKEKSFSDDTVALLARKLSEWFRKVGPTIGRLKIPVIELSQVRATNLHSGAYLDMTGGNAAKHWGSTILKVSRGQKITVTRNGEKIQLGFWMKIELKKTSICANEGKIIQLPFYFGIGIDNVGVAVRAGITKGLVQKGAAARVTYLEKSYASENQMVEKLREDGVMMDRLILDLAGGAVKDEAEEDPEATEAEVAESKTEDAGYEERPDGFVCKMENCGEIKKSLHGLRIHQGRVHKNS